MSDWAEKEAREWFKREFGTTVWDEKYYDSLAALLHRVREESLLEGIAELDRLGLASLHSTGETVRQVLQRLAIRKGEK